MLNEGGALNAQWKEAIYEGSGALGAFVGGLVTGGPGAAAGAPAGAVMGDIVIANTNSIVDMLFPVDPGAAITQNSDKPAVVPNTQTQPSQQTQSATSNKNMLLIGGAILTAGAIIYIANKKNK